MGGSWAQVPAGAHLCPCQRQGYPNFPSMANMNTGYQEGDEEEEAVARSVPLAMRICGAAGCSGMDPDLQLVLAWCWPLPGWASDILVVLTPFQGHAQASSCHAVLCRSWCGGTAALWCCHQLGTAVLAREGQQEPGPWSGAPRSCIPVRTLPPAACAPLSSPLSPKGGTHAPLPGGWRVRSSVPRRCPEAAILLQGSHTSREGARGISHAVCAWKPHSVPTTPAAPAGTSAAPGSAGSAAPPQQKVRHRGVATGTPAPPSLAPSPLPRSSPCSPCAAGSPAR